MQGHFRSVRLFVTLWTVACQASLSGRGVSRQEDWSILANTGCHTLLENYIPCCPSRQLPWVPGAARTPATQAAASPPHLALMGANPSPPRKPQEQIPVDDPHGEVEIKPQLNPGAVWLRKKTPNLPTRCTSYRLNPYDELGRLSVYGIYKRSLRASSHTHTKCSSSGSCGHWRQEYTGVGPD